MIETIQQISLQGDEWIDLDTYANLNDYQTARLAAGGLLTLTRNVLNGVVSNGFAIVRPPGHHATRNRSMGFCLFNNAALTAHELSNDGKRVLIFDHDVHHGNGTQDIFYNRNDIMYQSFHLSPHYPGTGSLEEIGIGKGEGYTINIPLRHGHGNKSISNIMDEIFLPIANQFKPDLILISAGFDSHHADPLGGLELTADFFGEIVEKFQKVQSKIICTLEGGYNLQWIGKCILSQLSKMTSNEYTINDSCIESRTTVDTNELRKIFRKYWDL
jgi:acetoin utilization deacetylase AcuC-like enzyme